MSCGNMREKGEKRRRSREKGDRKACRRTERELIRMRNGMETGGTGRKA